MQFKQGKIRISLDIHLNTQIRLVGGPISKKHLLYLSSDIRSYNMFKETSKTPAVVAPNGELLVFPMILLIPGFVFRVLYCFSSSIHYCLRDKNEYQFNLATCLTKKLFFGGVNLALCEGRG